MDFKNKPKFKLLELPLGTVFTFAFDPSLERVGILLSFGEMGAFIEETWKENGKIKRETWVIASSSEVIPLKEMPIKPKKRGRPPKKKILKRKDFVEN